MSAAEQNLINDDVFFDQQPSEMAERFRRFDDSQLDRFMWVAGDDIPLFDRAGGRFWGFYPGEVLAKRRLLPIRRAICLGINEYPALVGTAEAVNAPGYMAPVEAEGFERANSMRVVRPPKLVAYEIMGEFEDSAYGPALFEHAQLMGRERQDLVLKLYRAIVPRAVFADPGENKTNLHWHGEGVLKPVTRKGVRVLGLVTGTFLDQWKTYLTDFAADNVRRANLSRHKPRQVEGTDSPLSEHDLALYMLERMQEAVAKAWAEQTAYLESSREQILAKKGKRWYDLRDERYLLETGTVPVNLEQAMAQARAAEAQESAIMRGVEKIVERINPPVSQGEVAAQIQRQVEESLGELLDQMSPEQLQVILERKLRAQETLEVPAADPAQRREQNRQQRAQQKRAAEQQQQAAEETADGDDAAAGAGDELAPLDEQ